MSTEDNKVGKCRETAMLLNANWFEPNQLIARRLEPVAVGTCCT